MPKKANWISIKMIKIKPYKSTAFTRCLVLIAIIFVASCTNTPQNKSKTKSTMTPVEIKQYQEALTNLKSGELEKATSALTKLTQAHPTHMGAAINLAIAYYKNKKLDDASRILASAKKINANIPEVLNLSGLIAVEKGEYNLAEKDYLAAIANKKNYADAHYNLALVYDIFYQDFAKAVSQYEQYLALTGNSDKDTLNWVSELKLKQKRRETP
jgi:Tfp pilus assembly protein PilF